MFLPNNSLQLHMAYNTFLSKAEVQYTVFMENCLKDREWIHFSCHYSCIYTWMIFALVHFRNVSYFITKSSEVTSTLSEKIYSQSLHFSWVLWNIFLKKAGRKHLCFLFWQVSGDFCFINSHWFSHILKHQTHMSKEGYVSKNLTSLIFIGII